MRISVCMATRNGEKYIAEQMASILPQMGRNDEVVVSDDSSTDRTVAVIKGFADERIRVLEQNAFYSPIFNFENALRHATGDIIVLSDQDDIWLENKIAVIRERFARAASPVHLVVLDGYIVDEQGQVIDKSIFRRRNAGPGLLKNLYDNTYQGSCMAFSRQLLEVALPFPKRIPMHDVWLGLLAEIFGTVEFVGLKTMKYRKHAASVTDFRIQFLPVLQIKRRCFLTCYLISRTVERKLFSRGSHPAAR